jgi:hypothetical protein
LRIADLRPPLGTVGALKFSYPTNTAARLRELLSLRNQLDE